MPSVLQSSTTDASVSEAFGSDFFSLPKADKHTVGELDVGNDSKARNQPSKAAESWPNADDEFGVPIFTKQRLIPEKAPLDRCSFLLHHPMLQRSVEIIVPPGHTVSAQNNTIYPTIPDGPIYIHHRSALPNTPLQRAIHCTHQEYDQRQAFLNKSQVSSSSASLEYTFLQNQVGVIDDWLASMRERLDL